MPSSSHLRLHSSVEPFSAETTRPSFAASLPQKSTKMSLTQTYSIASSARSKLGKEACRPDHNLRRLVGHANLLDSLMLELQDAERQQEAWFHSTLAKATKSAEQRHVKWLDTIADEYDDDDSSDSDSESDDEDYYDEDGDLDMAVLTRHTSQSPAQTSTPEITIHQLDDDEDVEYDDDEDDADLALTRVPSQSTPELVHDDDSDDDSPPVSPPEIHLDFSEKEALLTTTYYGAKSQFHPHDTALFPPESTAPLITSY